MTIKTIVQVAWANLFLIGMLSSTVMAESHAPKAEGKTVVAVVNGTEITQDVF